MLEGTEVGQRDIAVLSILDAQDGEFNPRVRRSEHALLSSLFDLEWTKASPGSSTKVQSWHN